MKIISDLFSITSI